MVARESLILGVSRFSVRLEVKLSPVIGYVDVLSTSCRRPVDVLSTSCRRPVDDCKKKTTNDVHARSYSFVSLVLSRVAESCQKKRSNASTAVTFLVRVSVYGALRCGVGARDRRQVTGWVVGLRWTAPHL